jgi:hypothetical protein
MLNRTGLHFIKKYIPFFALFTFFGCANRQNPQGGPRDHTPPKLLKATPPNETRNFKAKSIELDFDEFFKLVAQSQEITMTPTPAKLPEYKIRKKSLVIDLKDSLEKNTTYVINFGKSIADVNEGNVLKNFTYVFSTGIHIDSLTISGTVINNETQQKEKDATVMLFTLKQDSLLFGKKKPAIYTTTDSSGNFTLNNMHPGDYHIYALLEKSPNKIYDNDNELIAFLSKTIHLKKDTGNIQLRLFKQEPEKFRLPDHRFDIDGKLFFTFSRKLNNPSLKIVYPAALDNQKIVEISKTKDTAIVYMKNMAFDSIRVAILDDNKPIDSTSLRKGKKESFQRSLLFTYDLSADYKLKPGTPFVIKANYPIDSFDPTLIFLKEDSTDVTNFTIERDSLNQKLFNLKYRWKQSANYVLTIDEGAFTDIYGDKNKRAIRKFQLDKPENYSQLTLNITVPDTGRAYIVELLNSQQSVIRKTIIHENSSIVYKNFITSKYYVRVIYDDNNNGKWDSGNVKRKVQPEHIWADKEVITLRPNWEQNTPIIIPKEPPTY